MLNMNSNIGSWNLIKRSLQRALQSNTFSAYIYLHTGTGSIEIFWVLAYSNNCAICGSRTRNFMVKTMCSTIWAKIATALASVCLKDLIAWGNIKKRLYLPPCFMYANRRSEFYTVVLKSSVHITKYLLKNPYLASFSALAWRIKTSDVTIECLNKSMHYTIRRFLDRKKASLRNIENWNPSALENCTDI